MTERDRLGKFLYERYLPYTIVGHAPVGKRDLWEWVEVNVIGPIDAIGRKECRDQHILLFAAIAVIIVAFGAKHRRMLISQPLRDGGTVVSELLEHWR